MPRPTTPHDFQTAAQRIDPDRSIRTLLPPTLDDLLTAPSWVPSSPF